LVVPEWGYRQKGVKEKEGKLDKISTSGRPVGGGTGMMNAQRLQG